MAETDNASLLRAFAELQTGLLRSVTDYLHERDGAEKGTLLVSLRDRLRDFRATLEAHSRASGRALPDICSDLFQQCAPNDALRLLVASFFFDVSKGADFWTQALNLARRVGLDPASSYHLLLNTEYLGFMNKGAFSETQYLQEVRRPLKDWYQELYDQRQNIFPSLPALNRGQQRVAVLLRLWRKPPLYAPALEALDYAYCLSKEFDCEVRLFNMNLLHDSMPLPFWPPGQFQPLPDSEEEQIQYKDAVFTLVHRRGPVFDVGAAQKLWAILQSFKPAFALALGDCNLFADILADAIPTITTHYTSDIPIQTQTIAGAQRDLIDRDAACAAMLNPGCRRVLLRPAAIDEPVRVQYARAQWGISDQAFVFAIVGNRLRSEITSEFLVDLDKIRQACANAWFVFTGFYDQGEQQLALFPALKARSTLIPQVEDVRGFMGIADALLNPERAGGGSVAAAALAAGKPVLTLARGDVAYIVGLTNTLAHRDDYVARAIELATNRRVYDECATSCRERYQELVDRRFNLLAIQEAIGQVW
jgi:glycosyltransferase involved in cell wall biosynthesis